VTGVLLGLALLTGCDSAPAPSTSPVPPPTPSDAAESPSGPPQVAFRWDSPRDGSKVSKRRLMLRAAPDVPGTSDGARVVFSIDWPGSTPHEACVATAPTDAGAWQCEVDLVALRAPDGSLKLDFAVEAQGGSVDKSPDGKRTVEYRPPAPTWRAARQVLPKGCGAPVLTIDGSSSYHVAATCDRGVGYAVGSAGGAWSARLFKSPTDRFDLGPQLAVDGDTLYLAFTRYRSQNGGDTCSSGLPYRTVGVYLRSRALPDGQWSAPHPLGPGGDTLDAIRVRDGTIHATVGDQRGASRYERISGSSVDRVPLHRVNGSSLRMGDDGKARMAYVDWKDGAIKLATVDGSDVTSTTVADRGILLDPLLVLGPGNQPHLVWTRFDAEDGSCGGVDLLSPNGTYYASLVDGKWESEKITKATGPTSFVLEPDTGAVHVLVNGNHNGRGGRLTHYERSPGGDWTSTQLRAPVDGGISIRSDESDGTLVVAYADNGIIRVMTRR
jgi:hypothetical protein